MKQPAPSAEAMLELLDVRGSAREPEMHSPHAYRIAARQDRLPQPARVAGPACAAGGTKGAAR